MSYGCDLSCFLPVRQHRFPASPQEGREAEGHAVKAKSKPSDLLDRTGYFGKRSVRVRSDQPYGSNHEDKDHCQHHGILGDILSRIVTPQSLHKSEHTILLRGVPRIDMRGLCSWSHMMPSRVGDVKQRFQIFTK